MFQSGHVCYVFLILLTRSNKLEEKTKNQV